MPPETPATPFWRRRGVGIILRVALVAAIVGLIAWRVDWAHMSAALHPKNGWYLILAIAANFASVVFKGVAWKGVVDALPEVKTRTRLHQVVSPLFVGFLFNTVLAARLGELVKVMLLRKRLLAAGVAVSVTALIGTVVAENVVSTIVWVLIVAGLGLFLPLPTYAWIACLGLGALCLTVVGMALITKGRRRGELNHAEGNGLVAKASRLATRLWAAVEEAHHGLRGPRAASIVTLASAMTWVCQIAGIYATLRAMGLDHVGWGGAGLLLVTVTLAQTFPVLPGNVGLFQAAATLPLTTVYGVSAGQGIAFSLVLQFTEVVVGVAFGFLFLMVEGTSFGQLRDEARRGGMNSTPTTSTATVSGRSAAGTSAEPS